MNIDLYCMMHVSDVHKAFCTEIEAEALTRIRLIGHTDGTPNGSKIVLINRFTCTLNCTSVLGCIRVN